VLAAANDAQSLRSRATGISASWCSGGGRIATICDSVNLVARVERRFNARYVALAAEVLGGQHRAGTP
jgi:hypothetical protein